MTRHRGDQWQPEGGQAVLCGPGSNHALRLQMAPNTSDYLLQPRLQDNSVISIRRKRFQENETCSIGISCPWSGSIRCA